MMAKSKENVSEILKAVPFDKALMIQNELDKYVRFLFANPDADKLKNPAQVPKQGRPKGQASSQKKTGSESGVSNPRARQDNTRKGRRMKDSTESTAGSQKRIKKEPNP